MKYELPPKPASFDHSVMFILVGMILEVIAICVHGVENYNGLSAVLIAYLVMGLAVYNTVRYLIAIEKGRLVSPLKLIVSIIIQLVVIGFTLAVWGLNWFFIWSMIMELCGTIYLFHPSTMLWFGEVKLLGNA